MSVCIRAHVLCAWYLCHPLRLPLLHLTNYSTMLSLEAKKWQPVNCVPIWTPPPRVCMPISIPVMLSWSKQHFGKNNQGEWDGVHHAARRLTSDGQSLCKNPPVSSLCLPSSVRLIISSLGGTWGVGCAWFSLWRQAGSRCLGCLWSGFYDYCWKKHTLYMACFFWHANPMNSSQTPAWSHLAVCTGLQYLWV